jgi:hypothetical protein
MVEYTYDLRHFFWWALCHLQVEAKDTKPARPIRLVNYEILEKFVDWRQCATVIQRDAVTVTPSCSGGGNLVIR